jgi:hypothetical protein
MHLHLGLPKDLFLVIGLCILLVSNLCPVCILLSFSPFALHALPISFPLFDHCNYTRRTIHIMKFLPLQPPPPSCHDISLRSEYSPRHAVLKHTQSVDLSQCQRPSSHPYRTTGKIIVSYTPMFAILDSRREDRKCKTER